MTPSVYCTPVLVHEGLFMIFLMSGVISTILFHQMILALVQKHRWCWCVWSCKCIKAASRYSLKKKGGGALPIHCIRSQLKMPSLYVLLLFMIIYKAHERDIHPNRSSNDIHTHIHTISCLSSSPSPVHHQVSSQQL